MNLFKQFVELSLRAGCQISTSIGSFFKGPEDKQSKKKARDIVYKIKCNDCDAVCIDKQDTNSIQQTGHKFDLDGAAFSRWNKYIENDNK